jgi:hypothetical protein
MSEISLKSSSTLVLQDSSTIQDEASLKLLLASVFRTTYLPAIFEDILSAFRESFTNKAWLPEEIVAEIERFLFHKIQSGSTNPLEGHRLLNQVSLHKMAVLEAKSSYHPRLKSNPNAVFWPEPNHPNYPRSLYDELPFATRHPFINKSTPIASLGSCFAIEIAKKLKQEKFNYLITEPCISEDFDLCSARWGIVFNTPTFRQIVEKSFGLIQLPRLLWPNIFNGQLQYRDPFREDVSFDSVKEYEDDYEKHIEASKRALLEAKVLILTMGMNEIWRIKSDGSVLSRCPWGVASFLVEPHVMTVEENISELQRALNILRVYNPEIKIILSVSPVPFHGTFRGEDYHVIAANNHSKSVLRIAAQQFVESNDNAYYFPSYETVLYCTQEPWADDQRHVSRIAVNNVMKLFEKMFVNTEESDALDKAIF